MFPIYVQLLTVHDVTEALCRPLRRWAEGGKFWNVSRSPINSGKKTKSVKTNLREKPYGKSSTMWVKRPLHKITALGRLVGKRPNFCFLQRSEVFLLHRLLIDGIGRRSMFTPCERPRLRSINQGDAIHKKIVFLWDGSFYSGPCFICKVVNP